MNSAMRLRASMPKQNRVTEFPIEGLANTRNASERIETLKVGIDPYEEFQRPGNRPETFDKRCHGSNVEPVQGENVETRKRTNRIVEIWKGT